RVTAPRSWLGRSARPASRRSRSGGATDGRRPWPRSCGTGSRTPASRGAAPDRRLSVRSPHVPLERLLPGALGVFGRHGVVELSVLRRLEARRVEIVVDELAEHGSDVPGTALARHLEEREIGSLAGRHELADVPRGVAAGLARLVVGPARVGLLHDPRGGRGPT